MQLRLNRVIYLKNVYMLFSAFNMSGFRFYIEHTKNAIPSSKTPLRKKNPIAGLTKISLEQRDKTALDTICQHSYEQITSTWTSVLEAISE